MCYKSGYEGLPTQVMCSLRCTQVPIKVMLGHHNDTMIRADH